MRGYSASFLANLPNNEEETGEAYLSLRHDLVVYLERLISDCEKAKATSLVITIVLRTKS